MGHQVEYMIDVEPARAREWLSPLPGRWVEPESADVMPFGEFEWRGLSLHAELGPVALLVSVPQIKYSWLIGDHAPSVEQIARLEGWMSESLAGAQSVRVDELLRLEWESQSKREWQKWPDPTRTLRNWLLSSRQDAAYFRLLPTEQKHAEQDAQADGCLPS